jgi:hypothetical protein
MAAGALSLTLLPVLPALQPYTVLVNVLLPLLAGPIALQGLLCATPGRHAEDKK